MTKHTHARPHAYACTHARTHARTHALLLLKVSTSSHQTRYVDSMLVCCYAIVFDVSPATNQHLVSDAVYRNTGDLNSSFPWKQQIEFQCQPDLNKFYSCLLYFSDIIINYPIIHCFSKINKPRKLTNLLQLAFND